MSATTQNGYRSDLAEMLLKVGKTRNGGLYDRATGARMTALTDDDLAYRYIDDDSLANAAFKYNGAVLVIGFDGGRRIIKPNYSQPEPIDYYAKQVDGWLVRCDKDGKLNPALEFLKQDWSGVIATGEVGPVGAVSDEKPPVFNWTQKLRDGLGQWKESEIAFGKAGFMVAFRTPKSSTHDTSLAGGGGMINLEASNHTPPQDFDFAVIIDGVAHPFDRANGLHLGIGMGAAGPNTPIVLPYDTDCGIFVKPVELQRSASGIAAITGEISLPGRGSGAAGYVW